LGTNGLAASGSRRSESEAAADGRSDSETAAELGSEDMAENGGLSGPLYPTALRVLLSLT